MDSKEIAVVRDFVAAINQGNASRLSNLMTEDHTFVDSRGKTESVCFDSEPRRTRRGVSPNGMVLR